MVISCFILVNKAHIGVLRSQTFCKRCRFLALLKTYTDSEEYIYLGRESEAVGSTTWCGSCVLPGLD
jgi:hypothetical protein